MALDVKEKNLIKFIVKRLVPILIVFFSFASYMELWNQPVRLLGFCLLAVWLIKFLNLALYFVRAKLFPRDPLSYGKWAIVTGATAGIGEAFAYELAARGMNVIIISRSLEKLEEVKKGILKETPGVEIRCMAYDYTDREGADAFFAKLAETCKGLVGGLGILVNNVGMVNAVSLGEGWEGGLEGREGRRIAWESARVCFCAACFVWCMRPSVSVSHALHCGIFIKCTYKQGVKFLVDN